MRRQHLHLSATPEMALQVGRRRDMKPVVLRIRAGEADEAGIEFGTPSGAQDNIHLVEELPPTFIDSPKDES